MGCDISNRGDGTMTSDENKDLSPVDLDGLRTELAEVGAEEILPELVETFLSDAPGRMEDTPWRHSCSSSKWPAMKGTSKERSLFSQPFSRRTTRHSCIWPMPRHPETAMASLHFSSPSVARSRRGACIQCARREESADVLQTYVEDTDPAQDGRPAPHRVRSRKVVGYAG